MLKIVSALNGSSVCQSLNILGIELQLQLKNIIFQHKKKLNIFFFWKNDFGLIFVGHIPRKTTYGRRPTKYFFLSKKLKKNIFFLFFGKKLKKYFFGWKFFFWSSSAEDDLWKTTWLIISLSCTSLMLVLAQYNFYFYSSKL